MKRFATLRKPSAAVLVSLVALFVALGGSSYAALSLPQASVDTKQLKNNAVTSAKVKPGSLLVSDFQASQRAGLAGPRGLQGPQGLRGTQGPQGSQGQTGDKGDTGAAGPLLDTLPSGQTLVGKYYIYGSADKVGDYASGAISYQFPPASDVNTYYLAPGSGPIAVCPGNKADPQAAPGHLCVYSADRDRVDTTIHRSSRFGTGLNAKATAVGPFFDEGTWAVTAP